MRKLSTQLALLAFAGTLTAMSPAIAAPQGSTHATVDCTLAANATNPFCVAQASGHRPGHNNISNGSNSNGADNGATPDTSQGNQTTTQTTTTTNGTNDRSTGQTMSHDDHSHDNDNNNHDNHGFNFNQHDRDQFHRQFHNFNFGIFSTPNFSINLGVRVPHSYHLRAVPRGIYHQYPQFRGDLYFVTRNGTLVIVSPNSLKIVAIL